MIGKITVPFRVLVLCLYLFLLGPMLIVVPLSFSNDSYLVFPPQSWGVRWYEAMFSRQAAAGLSGQSWHSRGGDGAVAGRGRAGGLCRARWRFPGRDALLSLFTAPLLLPSIVLGLAILLVFANAGLLGTYTGLIAAHLVVTTPYVMRIADHRVRHAAAVGGRGGGHAGAALTVFRRVTLPLLAPGFVASAALSDLVR